MKLKALLGTAVASAALLASAPSAGASPPPDRSGDRISWSSRIPCNDGAGGTVVDTKPLYNMPSAGTYRFRIGLYRSSDDARMALNTLGEYRSSGSGWVYFTPMNHRSSYTGNTYVVAYVFKLQADGSWPVVAREWVSCV